MKTLDFRNFVSFLEKDEELKEFGFTKTASLLKQSAKNCCKCDRKQKVNAFKEWVNRVGETLSDNEKNLILKKVGENFTVVNIDGNSILEV